MTPPFARADLDLRTRTDTRNHPITGLHGTPRRRIHWQTTGNLPLRQQRGYSAGFGWAMMLEQVSSERFPGSEMAALSIGEAAHYDDQSHSQSRIVGGSLLGAARHLKRRGWIAGYRWAKDKEEVLDILCSFGPVLLGVPWFESMHDAPLPGIVTVNGPQVGRHAILAVGFIPGLDALKMGLGHSDLVEFVNSFGSGYGVRGRGYLRIMDLAFLMKQGGEAVVPTNMQASERLSGWAAFASRPIVRRLTSPFRRD